MLLSTNSRRAARRASLFGLTAAAIIAAPLLFGASAYAQGAGGGGGGGGGAGGDGGGNGGNASLNYGNTPNVFTSARSPNDPQGRRGRVRVIPIDGGQGCTSKRVSCGVL